MFPRPPRPSARVFLIALLCASSLALAALSPLLISIALSGATLSVSTGTVPKGWFSGPGNTFDRTKSDLRTAVTLGATTCSTAYPPISISSLDGGVFLAVVNNGGSNVTGWSWSDGVDLTSYQNHWNNYYRCDSTVDVIGCPDAIPVTVTTTAYARSGGCHQYVNDAGTTVCASDTRSTTLPSVQDADTYEVCPLTLDGCGLGACESVCVHDCASQTFSGTTFEQHDARRACFDACVCSCMTEVRLGTECDLPAKCE